VRRLAFALLAAIIGAGLPLLVVSVLQGRGNECFLDTDGSKYCQGRYGSETDWLADHMVWLMLGGAVVATVIVLASLTFAGRVTTAGGSPSE
jgi:hypothetical protein